MKNKLPSKLFSAAMVKVIEEERSKLLHCKTKSGDFEYISGQLAQSLSARYRCWSSRVRFRAGQINTVSPTAHHCGVSVLPWRLVAELGPATRYTLRRNIESIMKIRFCFNFGYDDV